jgi:hypothetical protein
MPAVCTALKESMNKFRQYFVDETLISRKGFFKHKEQSVGAAGVPFL